MMCTLHGTIFLGKFYADADGGYCERINNRLRGEGGGRGGTA